MKFRKSIPLLLSILSLTAFADSWYTNAPLPYCGVNLAGGEFGDKRYLPGTYGKNYIYPNANEFDYFSGKRMNIVRLQFIWERIQRTAFADFNPDEWARLNGVVQQMLDRGMVVLLDPHNSARYYGELIGTTNVPVAAFADFWGRFATAYRDEPGVWFGLVNEPYGIDATNWLPIANAAIAAIRATGSPNRILVPGTAWSGAHSWLGNWYGTPNGSVMDGIIDPTNNFVIEVHQYLDQDSSGTHTNIVSSTIGSERLTSFTQWCRDRGLKAFLGEFACPRSDTGDLFDPDYIGYRAIDDMIGYMESNRDVWVGWTWWAAGPWWGEYMFTIEQKNGIDRPQLSVALDPHLMQADLDADKLGDTWEVSYFGAGGTSPNSDPDQDGRSNLEEYIIGTDPTSADQFVLSSQTSGNLFQLRYNTYLPDQGLYLNRNRFYDLYSTTNLATTWIPVPGETNLPATGTEHLFEIPNTNSANFFQIRARLE